MSLKTGQFKIRANSLNLNCKYEKDTIYGDPDCFHFKTTGRWENHQGTSQRERCFRGHYLQLEELLDNIQYKFYTGHLPGPVWARFCVFTGVNGGEGVETNYSKTELHCL